VGKFVEAVRMVDCDDAAELESEFACAIANPVCAPGGIHDDIMP
jgi:hypothetical protein